MQAQPRVIPVTIIMILAACVAVFGCRPTAPAGDSSAAGTSARQSSSAAPGQMTAPGETPAPAGDVSRPAPKPAAPPAFAPAGTGHPTAFQANCPAVLHFGGKTFALPVTLWFADADAPGGESPLLFRMRHDGSGYYDFTFADQPVRITDADGNELVAADVKMSIDADDAAHTRTSFSLTLIKP